MSNNIIDPQLREALAYLHSDNAGKRLDAQIYIDLHGIREYSHTFYDRKERDDFCGMLDRFDIPHALSGGWLAGKLCEYEDTPGGYIVYACDEVVSAQIQDWLFAYDRLADEERRQRKEEGHHEESQSQ